MVYENNKSKFNIVWNILTVAFEVDASESSLRMIRLACIINKSLFSSLVAF